MTQSPALFGINPPALIGIGGRLRAGKDEFAHPLLTKHGFMKLNMSTPIHELMYRQNPIIGVTTRTAPREGLLGLLGCTRTVVETQRYAELYDRVGYTEAKKHPEVRSLLQAIGQGARAVIDDGIWTDIARRSVIAAHEAGNSVIITGIRFPEERNMVAELGGKLVWVDRPDLKADSKAGNDITENSISAKDFDIVVLNDGTIEQLWSQAERIAGVKA